ncbi:MAG TPA: decaprenyl-phosphate phosphoribosyltransferase [Azospirillaceae bacterium]|nr:decaprenyl-phosphate phosphoribosyltransferase [Azospirillaceae bacterium]
MHETSDNGLEAPAAISRMAGRSGQGQTRPGQVSGILRLMRPHQWVKNAFVAAPLFFTPAALSPVNLALVLAGMMAFSLVASAVYILNDYVDQEADRSHPVKCRRPLASGEVANGTALGLFTALLGLGLVVSYALSPLFGALALTYFIINIGYSFGLKHVSIIDVLLITLGFTLRVYAGAVLIQVPPSVWIIVCTGLVALFIALAKRRDDLVLSLGGEHRRSLGGYSKPFLDTAVAIVLSALLISYIIYTTDRDVRIRLGTEHLFLTIPFVLAGIMRYLQIVLVEERSGAPTTLVLSDRFLITAIALWAVSFSILIHW